MIRLLPNIEGFGGVWHTLSKFFLTHWHTSFDNIAYWWHFLGKKKIVLGECKTKNWIFFWNPSVSATFQFVSANYAFTIASSFLKVWRVDCFSFSSNRKCCKFSPRRERGEGGLLQHMKMFVYESKHLIFVLWKQNVKFHVRGGASVRFSKNSFLSQPINDFWKLSQKPPLPPDGIWHILQEKKLLFGPINEHFHML